MLGEDRPVSQGWGRQGQGEGWNRVEGGPWGKGVVLRSPRE